MKTQNYIQNSTHGKWQIYLPSNRILFNSENWLTETIINFRLKILVEVAFNNGAF